MVMRNGVSSGVLAAKPEVEGEWLGVTETVVEMGAAASNSVSTSVFKNDA